MNPRIEEITVINNNGEIVIICDDEEIPKEKELWMRMLAFKSDEDLEKVYREAQTEGLVDLTDTIDRLRKILIEKEAEIGKSVYELSDEEFAELKGGGFELRVNSDDEKYADAPVVRIRLL